MADFCSPLFCDLYELTMAQAYWRAGVANTESVFHLFFRKAPFGSPFVVTCGLSQALEFLQGLEFQPPELEYLARLEGNDGRPLFGQDFLGFLADLRFDCDLEAVPEGTVMFAREPIMRIQGAVLKCQIVESALLNIVNFQSLVATKSARVCMAAGDNRVVEFGMRRAHGPNGAQMASRAAFIGGCHGTSNVLAGFSFNLPVSGTQAHSWIMFFGDESKAFDTYAQTVPNNCIFLVDTYESLSGVRHAIETASKLRARGHEMIGIRLDSGDLAQLSRRTRQLLNDHGFPDALIVASGDLDEQSIARWKRKGAVVDVWGVGSKLITGHSDSFLGGVYKIAAVRTPGPSWSYRIKLSEQREKSSLPGILQVRRYYNSKGSFLRDVIYNLEEGVQEERSEGTDLLSPVLHAGQQISSSPSNREAREHAADELQRLPPWLKDLENPVYYNAGIEKQLQKLRVELTNEAKGKLKESSSYEHLGSR